MNWPFFTLTARPVWAAASKQVGLPGEERRDLQQLAHLGGRRGLGRLVDVGRHRQASLPADLGEHLEPRRRAPGRGSELPLVRLALSNDALNTSDAGSVAAMRFSSRAISSARPRSSSTHGPAIHSSGWPLPTRYGPTWAGLCGTGGGSSAKATGSAGGLCGLVSVADRSRGGPAEYSRLHPYGQGRRPVRRGVFQEAFKMRRRPYGPDQGSSSIKWTRRRSASKGARRVWSQDVVNARLVTIALVTKSQTGTNLRAPWTFNAPTC